MTNESEHHLLVEREGVIVTITLNRPASRNALSRALGADLGSTLATLAGDTSVRALILTGAGDRAFCAGADLIERRTMTPVELTAHTMAINDVAAALAAFPVPTIAAIRGSALAGGAELALACDLRIASEDAILGFPEVKVGVFPGAGGVVRLPRLVGAGAARDLLYTGRAVPASEAFRIGLVERIVPSAEVLTTARAVAGEIAGNAPLAVRAVKRALLASDGLPAAEAQARVTEHRRPLDETRDYAEGLAAFAERRPPRFHGE